MFPRYAPQTWVYIPPGQEVVENLKPNGYTLSFFVIAVAKKAVGAQLAAPIWFVEKAGAYRSVDVFPRYSPQSRVYVAPEEGLEGQIGTNSPQLDVWEITVTTGAVEFRQAKLALLGRKSRAYRAVEALPLYSTESR